MKRKSGKSMGEEGKGKCGERGKGGEGHLPRAKTMAMVLPTF